MTFTFVNENWDSENICAHTQNKNESQYIDMMNFTINVNTYHFDLLMFENWYVDRQLKCV